MTATGTGGELTPDRVMQVGMGFWSSKALLCATRLGLFGELAGGARTAGEIRAALGLHGRGLRDFLDALVALGFLERDGLGDDAHYRNAPEADAFLDPAKPAYVGGFLAMANDRLYPFWANLEEALRTGEPQNEVRHEGRDLFDGLYEDPERLEQFVDAMAAVQMGPFNALAEAFDFSPYATVCDVGGASGALSIVLARRYGHLRCITLDLPMVEPVARRRIEEHGLGDRVEARSIDFWQDPLPPADVITMGNVLHDWGLDGKKRLMAGARESLPDGGALVAIENVVDDERRDNAFGLLMSLNMLIETRAGFDFTGAEFARWAREAGFRDTEVRPLAGPTSAAIAYK